jgi:hypothetical protein
MKAGGDVCTQGRWSLPAPRTPPCSVNKLARLQRRQSDHLREGSCRQASCRHSVAPPCCTLHAQPSQAPRTPSALGGTPPQLLRQGGGWRWVLGA